MLLMTLERRLPMVVEKINMKEGEMSGATDMTKGTHPELHKIERNVPTKRMCDIFESKDKMMNLDKALVEEPVLRSHKQVEKGTEHRHRHEVKAVPIWATAKEKQDKVEIMTTRATAMVSKDKMGMMANRAATKMSGQGEMPTFDDTGGVCQAGCDGNGPTNGAAVYPVSKPASAQIAGRMFYHGRNFTPITEGDVTRHKLE